MDDALAVACSRAQVLEHRCAAQKGLHEPQRRSGSWLIADADGLTQRRGGARCTVGCVISTKVSVIMSFD